MFFSPPDICLALMQQCEEQQEEFRQKFPTLPTLREQQEVYDGFTAYLKLALLIWLHQGQHSADPSP